MRSYQDVGEVVGRSARDREKGAQESFGRSSGARITVQHKFRDRCARESDDASDMESGQMRIISSAVGARVALP